jgi:pyruvate formate lyase activating enzyme
VDVFRHPAFELAGTELSPEQIVDEAAKSRMLFGRGGGVTFGGGEPTCQMDELLRALRLLRRASVNTTVETNASTGRFAELVGETDLLICDLKAVSARRHKAWTGRDNASVLSNLRLAARRQERLWVRVPVVPGLNDGVAEREAIAAFVKGLARNRDSLTVELLPFHHNGEPKYRALGKTYPMRGARTPSQEKMARLAGKLRGKRLTVRVGAQVW